jgi:hypothetical protein
MTRGTVTTICEKNAPAAISIRTGKTDGEMAGMDILSKPQR